MRKLLIFGIVLLLSLNLSTAVSKPTFENDTTINKSIVGDFEVLKSAKLESAQRVNRSDNWEISFYWDNNPNVNTTEPWTKESSERVTGSFYLAESHKRIQLDGIMKIDDPCYHPRYEVMSPEENFYRLNVYDNESLDEEDCGEQTTAFRYETTFENPPEYDHVRRHWLDAEPFKLEVLHHGKPISNFTHPEFEPITPLHPGKRELMESDPIDTRIEKVQVRTYRWLNN